MTGKIAGMLFLLLFLFGCGGSNAISQPGSGGPAVLPDTPATAARTIVCWGDSLTAGAYPSYLAARFASARLVRNYGIGGETSTQILNRIKGHELDSNGILWNPDSTIRLKTRRVVPMRELDESYRGEWERYGLRIAEPERVDFANLEGPIGTATTQLKAAAAVSGARLSAPGHPFSDGDEVYHLGEPLPARMYAGKVYFVRDADPSGYSLSEFPGQGAVSFGAGQVTSLGPFYYDWAYRGENRNVYALTHTDTDAGDAVLWMGANNVMEREKVKADIASAVARLGRSSRVLVLTCIANDQAVSGTAVHNALMEVNAWILAQYPDNSLDIYTYLRSKYDPALPRDVADLNLGIIPSSLRVDTIHLNAVGNQLVADKVHDFFVSHGW